MNKSKKGYVPIMVKPETKQLVKDLMPAYEDTYDETVKDIAINARKYADNDITIEKLKRELYNANLKIERLEKIIKLHELTKGHGEVMEAEAGRE